ncbi:hypothetical protein [Streptomyces wuyuanensis]|uniref:Uncharacterized protein n=1 Tax=Streptomyces wuyuanensis TaxID=1196353 RepID=A0A1H0DPC0_9ACTN|nr:hypothetical protein [Streptomyces wuyuanensis]SDN71994.1 hypothetical protein SAMN05444921_13530 [Streptomyces wuyuanensis]
MKLRIIEVKGSTAGGGIASLSGLPVPSSRTASTPARALCMLRTAARAGLDQRRPPP